MATGFILSYNTPLVARDHPEVIKIIQSGKTGAELRRSLKKVQLFQDAFDDLWGFANEVAKRHKMETVNVCMEHSEDGDHEARVHFHVFMGLDVHGGVGFEAHPSLRVVHHNEFLWRQIAPHVKPTIVQRKSWSQICLALTTGSYYVAGPKFGEIMKRSTHEPIQDTRTDCDTFQQNVDGNLD